MKKFAITCMLVASMGLTACESTQGWGTKQTIGTGGGAVLGGLAGSQIGGGSGRLWATGAGVLLGALVGSEIGQSLDRADKTYMTQAQSQVHNAPVGQTISWNNPQSGNNGTFTPVRDGRDSNGSYCREYQQTVTVGGQKQSAYGTACQMSDGTWQIVK